MSVPSRTRSFNSAATSSWRVTSQHPGRSACTGSASRSHPSVSCSARGSPGSRKSIPGAPTLISETDALLDELVGEQVGGREPVGHVDVVLLVDRRDDVD